MTYKIISKDYTRLVIARLVNAGFNGVEIQQCLEGMNIKMSRANVYRLIKEVSSTTTNNQ